MSISQNVDVTGEIMSQPIIAPLLVDTTATADAYKFCGLVSSSNFAETHAELVLPLSQAVENNDPDTVARIAAEKLDLHFTGTELKQVGGAIEEKVNQAAAALTSIKPVSMLTTSREVPTPWVDGTLNEGFNGLHNNVLFDLHNNEVIDTPPGGVTVGWPGGGASGGFGFGLKMYLRALANLLKQRGESAEEIRQALLIAAGGANGALGNVIDGSNITGISDVDDVMKSIASGAAGAAQGAVDTGKTIVNDTTKVVSKIFSGW